MKPQKAWLLLLICTFLSESCLEDADVELSGENGIFIAGYAPSFDGPAVVEIFEMNDISVTEKPTPVPGATLNLVENESGNTDETKYTFQYHPEEGVYLTKEIGLAKEGYVYRLEIELAGGGTYESSPILLSGNFPDFVDISIEEDYCGDNPAGGRYSRIVSNFKDEFGSEGKQTYLFEQQALRPFSVFDMAESGAFFHRDEISSEGISMSFSRCMSDESYGYVIRIPGQVENFMQKWIFAKPSETSDDSNDDPLEYLFAVPPGRLYGNIRKVSGEGDGLVIGVFFPSFAHEH